MAIRINADFQAVYIHEPLGHAVPALNAAWTVAGLYRLEADVNLDTLICALYGTTAAANWVGLYMNADGTSCRLEGFNGGTPVTSGSYTLEVGRDYRLAIDYDGAGTVRMLLDGVAVLSLAFTPNPGTLGERSLQWGGFGEISGYTSCTLARWRMWSAVLTEAEHRAEYRSLGPVRTAGLLHNWPMDPGASRLDDTVGGQPDLAENPTVPVTDGTAFVHRPSIIGTPQFFPLGETATPGAQAITVPNYAEKVAIFVHQSDDAATPDASLSSLTSNFAGTFTIDQIGSSSVAMAVALATADVTSTGAGKSWTPTLANTNIVAGAAAWVVFLQDVGSVWPTDTAVAQVTGDGTTPGTASGSGLVDGLAIAADTHLYATSGTYPANEAGWTSVATAETTGTYAYWASSRLRQRAITASGTESATTQGANGSCIALLTLPPAALAAAIQTARPDADISDGPWTPSTGTDLYAVLNETTANDATYIQTSTNGTAEIGLQPADTPGAGAQTLTYRASGTPDKALTVGLYQGATLVEQWTTDPVAAAVTEYVRTLTTGITDGSDLRVRFTSQDAAAPPTANVTFGAIGTGASGTTTCAPSHPTGISASTSKLFCVITGESNTAGTAPTMPAGWTKVLDFEGGVGTWAADTGPRRVTVFQKDTVTGTETGTVTVSLAGNTTNNTLRATIMRVEVPVGYGIDVAASTGADITSGTAFSVTGSTAISFAPGDLLLIAVAQATDTATQSAQSITASGITFGTRTNRGSVAVTNGNDHRHIFDTVPVNAGTATVAPTYSYTASAATSGPGGFLRMRAVPPASSVRVTSAALAVPAGDGTTAHALAASGAAQASGSAGLGLGKPLAGAGLGQAAGSAALTVEAGGSVVDLSAAGAAQVASSAALALAVTLAAQASAQAAGSAVLTVAGNAALSAAGTAQASGSAALLQGVTLSAAALAVASGGAALSHTVPLSATAAAIAQAGGSLALAVTLSAGALAQASATAGLGMAKPLQASGAGVASGTAALSTSGATELAAAGAAQAGAAATLSLVVGLSAAGAAQAAAAASLATGKPLAAAGAAQAAGTAGLQVGSATGLQASGAAQATGGATLWLDVPISAAALAQALAGGSLTLTVPLAAAALAQAGGIAQLASAVTLVAGGQALAAAQAGLQVMGPMSQYSRGMRAMPASRSWRVAGTGRTFRHQPDKRAWRAVK